MQLRIRKKCLRSLYIASPQQGDLKRSGEGAGGGARTRDRRVPTDLRADSLAIEPNAAGLKTTKSQRSFNNIYFERIFNSILRRTLSKLNSSN
ncbi:hypothetical protein PoB_005994500 [Plakobranchus ocellatus]|uniref:Uncharacterized protein n=1 Tax=Plakobranchus ocellatus TaxID=259542 RepID=A0AAV4CNJ9_9GAST|nr:hypothetical protein PoB_005994500 [Plakobranchus ocellatus]